MQPTDLLIIYLAFGAPIAVYKYLQNGTEDRVRRIASSALTFLFWIPAAVRIAYLYFTNADFEDAFVSQSKSDAFYKRICKTRDALASELVRAAVGFSVHEVREAIERYAGLADALGNDAAGNTKPQSLFAGSGRTRHYELGLVCWARRNRRRLERHHIEARRDFVALLDRASYQDSAAGAIVIGIDLARQLDDTEAVELLKALDVKKGEVWKPQPHEQPQTITSSPPIVMTASLNND
jgi:hypothetical protein